MKMTMVMMIVMAVMVMMLVVMMGMMIRRSETSMYPLESPRQTWAFDKTKGRG